MQNQSHKFSLDQEISYFNMAYMSPLLKEAQDRGVQGLMKKGDPSKITVSDFFDDVAKLKAVFAKLINAKAEQVAIIPSVSYGMANAAKNLHYKSNGEILVLQEQFPSNYYPWEEAAKMQQQKMIKIGSDEDSKERTSSWNQNILNAINENTTAVCCGHVHWADGTLFDLKSISRKCKENHAYLIIDGTQSIGALNFNLEEIRADVLVVGGYKWLLGHYGLGLAYYSDKFNQGNPIEHNWINKKDSRNFQTLVDYKDEYQEGAIRYSMGEQSNFVHVPILLKGIEQILEWGVDNIQDYCTTLHELLIDSLKDSPFAVQQIGESSSHLTAIRVEEGIDMDHLKKTLLDNNIYVSYRGDAIRISFYVFNDESQVRRFASILKNVLTKT